MNFDLKKPCKLCPFRTDCPANRPGEDRAEEIAESITTRQQSFPCHETTEFDDDGDRKLGNKKEQHCAGAMILLERLGEPNQMMRIAERLRLYDSEALDMCQPVFDSPEDFIEHHSEHNRPTTSRAVEPEGDSG